MHESTWWLMAPWSNFYVIVGSAAAGLTGLMFVVITLVADGRMGTTHAGIATFSTPTIVHFGAALFVAASLAAPWRSLTHVVVLLGLTGVIGLVYALRVIVLAKNLTQYRPGADDWTWYAILPLVAYLAILASALLLTIAPKNALFVLAAGVLLLVFIGIHNAWDVVVWIAVGKGEDAGSDSKPESSDR
jgi:hypothetical protein